MDKKKKCKQKEIKRSQKKKKKGIQAELAKKFKIYLQKNGEKKEQGEFSL